MLAQWPTLADKGIAQTYFVMNGCAIRPPHTHMKATGLLFAIQGENLGIQSLSTWYRLTFQEPKTVLSLAPITWCQERAVHSIGRGLSLWSLPLGIILGTKIMHCDEDPQASGHPRDALNFGAAICIMLKLVLDIASVFMYACLQE